MSRLRRRSHRRPEYILITTNSADMTLGEGEHQRFPVFLDAVNAFVKSPAPYKTLVADDGCARFLNRREERLLRAAAAKLGVDIEDV